MLCLPIDVVEGRGVCHLTFDLYSPLHQPGRSLPCQFRTQVEWRAHSRDLCGGGVASPTQEVGCVIGVVECHGSHGVPFGVVKAML